MKKNSLTTAVVAGIAGVAGVGSIADAVNLNPDGLGQVLIYPYYTTQGGNDTLVTVVNTANIGKAVKVRFLEGRNSREVLDFHLYLSPHDVWTASIVSADAVGGSNSGGAGVITTDRSCTVPDIARGIYLGQGVELLANGKYYAPFSTLTFSDDVNDGETESPERTREGYLEIIEMADIDPTSSANGWITHDSSGEPANCMNAIAAWDLGGGYWTDNPANGMLAPNGKGELFGNAMIVNPDRGTVLGYAADALEGFNYSVSLHQPPGDTNPGLESVNNPGDLLSATAYTFAYDTVSGGLAPVTATYDDSVPHGKVDAITALYMSPRVINEYYLDEDAHIRATSEWVINFPTKRYYVDTNLSLSPVFGGAPFIFVPTVRAPFSDAFGSGGSCQNVAATVYDREERTAGGPALPPFSPRPPGPRPDALCWEAQVITFGQFENATNEDPSDILGSTYYKNVEPNYDNGWAVLSFTGSPSLRSSDEGVVFNGLPVTGFFATNLDNAHLDGGILANYSALFRHRTERSVAVS